MTSNIHFIGEIMTPYHSLAACPNNITLNGPLCKIVLYDDYKAGLLGLVEGQSVTILYWLEGTNRNRMHQGFEGAKPVKGTFALRSPHRPNPIGLAVLRIVKLTDGELVVRGLDCLNKTQLIDIKPAIYKEV